MSKFQLQVPGKIGEEDEKVLPTDRKKNGFVQTNRKDMFSKNVSV